MFYLGLGYSWDDYVNVESSSILTPYTSGRDMYQLTKYIDIIGDTRTGHTIHQTIINLMTANKPYLIFHVGDLVNNGSLQSDWDIFHAIEDPLILQTRFYPAIGNHDDYPLYFDQFVLPGNEQWYSVDVDNIHHIILDSTESLAAGSTQYNWLHTDLDNVPAATRFTLVYFHHPPYTVGGLADAIALFETHGVDAVFNGHTHLYASMVSSGIYYFITGGGGAPLSSCPVGSYTTCSSTYEYFRLLLNNNQLEVRVYNSSGTLIDSVDIVGV
jgi:predicted phosphodiesterase